MIEIRALRRFISVSLWSRLGLVTSVSVVLGCGTSVPSEGAGKDALVALIDSGSTVRLRVVTFKKLDGQSIEFAGVREYSMEYTATIALDSSMFFSTGPMMSSGQIRSRIPDAGDQGPMGFSRRMMNNERYAEPGDKILLNGSLSFVLKESGWRVNGFQHRADIDTGGRALLRRAAVEESIARLATVPESKGGVLVLEVGQRSGKWALLKTGQFFAGTTMIGFSNIVESVSQGYNPPFSIRIFYSPNRRVALVLPWDIDRGGDDIAIVDVRTGAVRGVSDMSNVSSLFEWSPDGRFAFSTSGYEGTWALLLVDVERGRVGTIAIDSVVPLKTDPCGRFDFNSVTWLSRDTVQIRGIRHPDGHGCVEPGRSTPLPSVAVEMRFAPTDFLFQP